LLQVGAFQKSSQPNAINGCPTNALSQLGGTGIPACANEGTDRNVCATQHVDRAALNNSITAAQQKAVQPSTGQLSKFEQRLHLPPQFPGAGAELNLPPYTVSRKEKKAALQALFPPLPALPPLPAAVPGPFGHPLTLVELQQLAMANSPVLRQAAADVVAA